MAGTTKRLRWNHRGMSDRGLGLQFGIFPEPSAAEPERILDLVLRAERGGLDLIGIQDHPYQRRHLDALVLITWLIGRTADGWLPSSAYLPPAELPERMARIDAAAVAAGRDPAAVRRLYNVSGRIDDRGNGGFLQGPPDRWVDELTGLVTGAGMESFILWPAEPGEEQVERFATEVAPAVRAAVAAARGRSGD